MSQKPASIRDACRIQEVAQTVAVERLLGRRLQSDEAAEVIARKLVEAPAAEEIENRKRVTARIRELARCKVLGGATVRDIIDEGRRF